jgi:catechol 2,3-dioxygenase-like lactoylglutathione lyase family enzyme
VSSRIVGIDHVQLAMPPGGEDAARGFYAGLLGLNEVPKPAELAGRGGCWFEAGQLRLHLGVELDFCPAKKAHPALRVSGFSKLIDALREAGCLVSDEDRFDGAPRVYLDDPFGNRIELIAE